MAFHLRITCAMNHIKRVYGHGWQCASRACQVQGIGSSSSPLVQKCGSHPGAIIRTIGLDSICLEDSTLSRAADFGTLR